MSALSTTLAQRELSLPAHPPAAEESPGRVRGLVRAIRAAVRRPEAISGGTQPRIRWP